MSLQGTRSDDSMTVLSKTRQKKSIGEVSKLEKRKKATSAKVVRSRTLVVRPVDIEWPFLKEDKNVILLEEIKESLKILRSPFEKISLSEIRKVPKEERKRFRDNFRLSQAIKLGFSISDYIELRSCLSIGVNCNSRSLEDDELMAVLIDPDVNPSIITKLLIPIAMNHSVPILAVKGLADAVKTATSIKCIALGFKRRCEEESNPFNYIAQTVLRFHHDEFIAPEPEGSQSQSETLSASYFKPPKFRKVTN